MIKLEICAGSLDDAIAAYNGGADRIELNSALNLGGLTPSVSTLKLVKEYVKIPVCTMVRPRAAGFNYSEKEIEVIFKEAKDLLDNGSDGIVFGFLNENSEIDYKLCQKMVEHIKTYQKEAIFHRAFDCLDDPYTGLETLIELKVDRVLTSGLNSKVVDSIDLLKDLQKKYGDKIEILAGSGINSDNVLKLIDETGLKQVHSSCKSWMDDKTTHHNKKVDFSYNFDSKYEVVSEEKVNELKRLLETRH